MYPQERPLKRKITFHLTLNSFGGSIKTVFFPSTPASSNNNIITSIDLSLFQFSGALLSVKVTGPPQIMDVQRKASSARTSLYSRAAIHQQ